MAANALQVSAITGLVHFKAGDGNLHYQAEFRFAILTGQKLPIEPRHDHRNAVLGCRIHNQALDQFPLVGINANGSSVTIPDAQHDVAARCVRHTD